MIEMQTWAYMVVTYMVTTECDYSSHSNICDGANKGDDDVVKTLYQEFKVTPAASVCVSYHLAALLVVPCFKDGTALKYTMKL